MRNYVGFYGSFLVNLLAPKGVGHGDFGARVGEVLVELVVGSASGNALLDQPVLQVLPQQLVELQLKGVVG